MSTRHPKMRDQVSTAASDATERSGGLLSPVVVKFHGDMFERFFEDLVGDPTGITVVVGDDDPPADLVLWSGHEIDESSIRAVIAAHHPTPVFIVLDGSADPAHVAQCLRAGAAQCLIEPADRELRAHIHATVRRLRFRHNVEDGYASPHATDDT